jgi:cytochrome-b5 reductase
MSKAHYAPPSLNAMKPTCVLVPPGQCQFTEDWTTVQLLERVEVSSTSSVLRFGLPNKDMPLNLSTCACILAKASLPKQKSDNNNGEHDDVEDVIRPYTPISTNDMNGCFDLLIKDYGETGRMSHHVCHDMKVGDTLDFKHIEFNVKIQAPFKPKTIVMLVGGTGITPMIQALHAILGDPDSQNNVVMLYGSQVSTDILGQAMVDQWAKDFPDRLKVIHTLSNEPDDSSWTGRRGFIDKSLIEEYAPGPSVGDDVMFFICGPPPMYNALTGPRGEPEVKGVLKELGYNDKQVYKF